MKHLFLALLFLLPTFFYAQIVNVEDLRTTFKDSIGWYENFDLEARFVKNTKEVFAGSGSIQLEFLHLNRRFISISEFRFLKAGGAQFINEGMQHLRYNIGVSSWYTHEIFAQLQYNEQTQVKLRGLLGSGSRIPIIRKKNYSIFYGLAYMFEYNEENKNRRVFRDHRLSSYLSFRIKPAKNIVLASTSYYQPVITDFDVYRISTQNTLEIKLTKVLAFTVKYSLNYDARIREGVPKLVYSWTNGLRLKL